MSPSSKIRWGRVLLASVVTHVANVVDDEPVTWRDFTRTLAEAYRTLRPLTLPRLVLRLAASYLTFVMTSTLRLSNARAKRGWTPSVSTYRQGITWLGQALGEREPAWWRGMLVSVPAHDPLQRTPRFYGQRWLKRQQSLGWARHKNVSTRWLSRGWRHEPEQ
jgi:hypothetical protein